MSETTATELWRRQLVVALDGLVPLHMLMLGVRGIGQERVERALETIAASGDAFEPGGKRTGDARGSLLGSLAEGIAVLALTYAEGVDLFGGHWCRDHSQHQEVAS